MPEFLIQQRPLLMAVATALTAVVGIAWLARERLGLLPGEREAWVWVRRHPLPPRGHRALITFVSLGRPQIACLTVAALSLGTTAAAGWRAGLLVFLAATVVGPARALKARARHQTVPSGHVAYCVSLFGMVACVALQQGHVTSAAVFGAAAVAMGPARILDGGHWLADVAAGYAFGLAWLLTLLLIGFAWALPG